MKSSFMFGKSKSLLVSFGILTDQTSMYIFYVKWFCVFKIINMVAIEQTLEAVSQVYSSR
jgi:hypothetical protein